MNRKLYRICLLMVIAVAVVSAVWYYQAFMKQSEKPKEGIFVYESTEIEDLA